MKKGTSAWLKADFSTQNKQKTLIITAFNFQHLLTTLDMTRNLHMESTHTLYDIP